MDRQSVAYLLLVLIGAAILAGLTYRWYFGRERSYHRRVAREDLAYEKAMAAKSDET